MESSRQILEESTLESCLNTAGVSESDLLPHLNLGELIQLTRTNRRIHGLFAVSPLKEALLDVLMSHLAHIIVNQPNKKNIEELKKTLTLYPEYPKLLTRKIKNVVFQETGQAYIGYSLLQLAFAEGDDELCHVFVPCFERAFGSLDAAREEIRRQLNEKFSEKSEEEKQYREAEEKNQLIRLIRPVIKACIKEQFNNGEIENKFILSPATLEAVTTFRETFNALQPKMIDKGARFSLNTLQVIFDEYAQYIQRGRCTYYRCTLLEDGVLSLVLNYLPQNDAMRCCQGLYYLQMKNPEPFERRIALRGTKISFHDFLRGPSSYFSTLSGSYVDIAWGGHRAPPGPRVLDMHQNLCRTKTANVQNFRSQPENILRHNHNNLLR